MNSQKLMSLDELIVSEELHVKKLEDLVRQSVGEEELLTSKLLEIEGKEALSLSQRLADRVAVFGGSWVFIIAFLAFMFLWIAGNAYWLANSSFDPYPFIFLNLILSCIAALQAPIIMMSQNRQEEKDRRRGRSDYLVNLKAEMEVRSLNSKIDLLLSDEMKTLFQVQRSQMELLLEIQSKLNQTMPR